MGFVSCKEREVGYLPHWSVGQARQARLHRVSVLGIMHNARFLARDTEQRMAVKKEVNDRVPLWLRDTAVKTDKRESVIVECFPRI